MQISENTSLPQSTAPALIIPARGHMARKRYQKGQLIKDGDRWLGRWREDVLLSSGQVKRLRRKDVICSVKDFPTKRAAQRELDKRLSEVNSVEYRPLTMETFAGYAQKWMESVMVQHKRSSQASEKCIVRRELIPIFGTCQLRDITPEIVQRYVSARTTSGKTTRNIITVFKTMWTTAKAWGYVSHNPFHGLRFPAHVRSQTYHFSVGEALAIIDQARGHWKLFIRILAETGCRPGELAGLRCEDVGLRSIRIAQSVWGRRVQAPKTQNAIRSFAISLSLAEALQGHIRDSPKNRYGLLFISGRGGPIGIDQFTEHVLGPILKDLGIRAKLDALGIKKCGAYAFRHMSATLMDELGVPLKVRQKRLGHADIETTLLHYTHAEDAEDRRFADQIGTLLESGEVAVQ